MCITHHSSHFAILCVCLSCIIKRYLIFDGECFPLGVNPVSMISYKPLDGVSPNLDDDVVEGTDNWLDFEG